MRRVVYLSPVGVIGGGEQCLIRMVAAVGRELPGLDRHVLLGAPGPLEDRLRAVGATVEILPLPAAAAGLGESGLRRGGGAKLVLSGPSAAVRLVGYVRALRHRLDDLRPDLVHSNGIKTHLLGAVARPRGVPLVWHIHDFLGHRPLMRYALRWFTPRVAAAVAVSRSVAADAKAVLGRVPVVPVYNAIDTDHFAPADRDGADLDRLAGLPPDPEAVRVGLVATYANWKGQDVFLDALARVPGVRGYVIGGPIYATAGSQFTRDELEARAKSNGLAGRVGFVPFQTDPADVYRMLDVVVHASIRPEPFGLTIGEAMSCGKAVVVSAAGGAAELFTDGLDGLGHRPGDVAGLAAAIRRLADDPNLRRLIGANARRTAVERFGTARYGREMAAVYRSVAGEWSASGVAGPLRVPTADHLSSPPRTPR